MHILRIVILLAAVLLTGLHGAAAQPQPGTGTEDGAPKLPTEQDRIAERRAAWQAAERAATRGPATVALRDQAKLDVPAGAVFIPQAEATRLSRALGNHPGPSMVGIVTTLSDADEWMVIVTWTPEGYVRDDEAKDLDPAAILKSLEEGTAEGNEDRAARGFPLLVLTGWIQPPQYDAAAHQLAWSLGVREKDGPADAGTTVNFNTRALGRGGYLSLNLITGEDAIAKDRAVAATLLAGLRFDEGKRYADFNEGTDHVAEYGLAALIGVVVAKKLGFLALAGVFLLKFAKVGLLAVAGVGVALKRLFRRKPTA